MTKKRSKKSPPPVGPTILDTSPPLSPRQAVAAPHQRHGAQLATGPRLVSDSALYEDHPGPPDPEEQAGARSQAFAARHSFAGVALEPFSKSRERLLLDIRGASGAGEFGRMDVLFGDALRFTWLCLQKGNDLERFQAGIGLPGLPSWPLYRRFQIAIDRWAEANSEAISRNREAMIDTFLDVWRESQIVHAIPESSSIEDGAGDEGN